MDENKWPSGARWLILQNRPQKIINAKDHLINSFRYDTRLPRHRRLAPRLKDLRAERGQAPNGYNWASEMLEHLTLGEEMDVGGNRDP